MLRIPHAKAALRAIAGVPSTACVSVVKSFSIRYLTTSINKERYTTVIMPKHFILILLIFDLAHRKQQYSQKILFRDTFANLAGLLDLLRR
jgi:hypothetical protein